MSQASGRPRQRARTRARARRVTLVYVGPTLPAAEVVRLLPDAEVLPPASVGDVLRAARRPEVARIAIIDGYFERMAAVWHKEILVALSRGIAVWGAASMGALRAAELAPYGMIGVGAIFRDYARGRLVADDEVAVAHLPADYAYRATSDALVNLRDGLTQAAKAQVITSVTATHLVTLAQRRFYRERSWEQLVRDARAGGLAVGNLERWLADRPRPDRKAADARLLLRRLRADRHLRTRRIRVPRTWALRQLESMLL